MDGSGECEWELTDREIDDIFYSGMGYDADHTTFAVAIIKAQSKKMVKYLDEFGSHAYTDDGGHVHGIYMTKWERGA